MKYLLLVVVIFSAILRFVNINQSFWLDEGISVMVAKNLNFQSIIFDFAPGDFHPPLYYLTLKVFMTVLGSSELTARLLSIISGTLTTLATYLIANKLYERKTAFVASLLVATSPLLIYYSQEARMYSLAALFAVMSLYFFVSILKEDKIQYWLGFIFFSVMTFYTDYMPIFILPSYLLFLILFRKKFKKATLRSFIPALILIFAVLAPWVNIFVKQLKSGLSVSTSSSSWSTVIGSATPKDLAIVLPKFIVGRISPENDLTYFFIFLPIAAFIFLLLAIYFIRINTIRSSLWFFLIIPIALSFGLSLFVPIFSYFRLLFVLPVLYVLLASAICNLNWTKPKLSMILIMMIINFTSLGIYFTNPKFQRENWREATRFVIDSAPVNSIALFESSYVLPTFDFYNNGKVKASGALDSFSPNPTQVAQNVQNYTQGVDTVFLFHYLAPISDPQGLVFKSLIENGFKNTDTKDFNGVGFVYVFEK